MKKLLILGAVVIGLALLVLVGVNSGLFTLTSNETIKIGLSAALTGKYAFLGESYGNGFSLAVDEINSKGGIDGKQIELIVEDDKGDIKEAILNTNKFLNVDNTKIVVTEFTHISKAVAETLKDKDVLYLYVSTYPPIAQQSKLFFRDYFDVVSHANVLGDKLIEDNCMNLVIFSENTDQGNLFKEVILNKISNKVNVSYVADIDPNSMDLSTDVSKANIKDGDCILSSLWRQADLLMPKLKEYGLLKKARVYSLIAPYMPSANTLEMQKLFNENKTISTWYGFGDKGNTKLQDEFKIKYKNNFGKDALPDSAYAYDDAYLLITAIDSCNNTNADCLSNHLSKSKYSGVSGTIEFDENRSSIREVLLIQMNNGVWERIN